MEKGVVRNINSFTDYLLSFKCPGLIIRKDFTPDANHGAALAQVMQNAIAFGYCERHKAIKVDPAIFNKYKGKYISKNKSLPDALIFTEKNKLYWKFTKGDDLPSELIPMSKTEYFMAENERILFTFRIENNKTTMVVVPDDKNEFFFKGRIKDMFSKFTFLCFSVILQY